MSITLDGFTFELADFTGSDGLGHTELQAAATGAASGASYPEEPLFPERVFRAFLNQIAIDNATTSTTSNDITTGSQTFTLAAPILNVGEYAIFAQTSNVANFIYGQVTGVSGNDVTINGTATGGSGTSITDWSVTGGAGAQGAAGADGDFGLPIATSAGTSTAYTANFSPDAPTTNGCLVVIDFHTANTSTTPTLAIDGLTARTLVMGDERLAIPTGRLSGLHLVQIDNDNSEYRVVGGMPFLEIKDAQETVYAKGNVSGAVTLDYRDGRVQTMTLTGNVTSLTINNLPPSGKAGWLTVIATQDGTGGRTMSLSSAYKTQDAAGITLSTAAGARDKLRFETIDNGTIIDAFINQNMS